MAWNTLQGVNLGLQKNASSDIFVTPRSEGKTDNQLQNGVLGNHWKDQSWNIKQVHIWSGCTIVDCIRWHTYWSILRYGIQWTQTRFSMWCDGGQSKCRFHPSNVLWSIPGTKSQTRHPPSPLCPSEYIPGSNCDRDLLYLRQLNSWETQT